MEITYESPAHLQFGSNGQTQTSIYLDRGGWRCISIEPESMTGDFKRNSTRPPYHTTYCTYRDSGTPSKKDSIHGGLTLPSQNNLTKHI